MKTGVELANEQVRKEERARFMQAAKSWQQREAANAEQSEISRKLDVFIAGLSFEERLVLQRKLNS